MDTMDRTMVSEAEAGVLLQISVAGVVYLTEIGQLRPYKGQRSCREYKLEDVLNLVEYRRLHPAKRGRPSAQSVLVRKLRDIARQRELVEA